MHVGENSPGQWGVSWSGMRVRHLNLSHPSHSASLQAPLAKAAGGWGLCGSKDGKAVFSSTSDGDYRKMLSALKQAEHRDPGVQTRGVAEILRDRSAGK